MREDVQGTAAVRESVLTHIVGAWVVTTEPLVKRLLEHVLPATIVQEMECAAMDCVIATQVSRDMIAVMVRIDFHSFVLPLSYLFPFSMLGWRTWSNWLLPRRGARNLQ